MEPVSLRWSLSEGTIRSDHSIEDSLIVVFRLDILIFLVIVTSTIALSTSAREYLTPWILVIRTIREENKKL